MLELANGGTILLNEIAGMDLNVQSRLLHVLLHGEFQRMGGKETIRVDVRVIAATNQDVEKAITDGQFRKDLFYRLNVVPINIPPLRERKSQLKDETMNIRTRASVKITPHKTIDSIGRSAMRGNQKIRGAAGRKAQK